MLSTFYQVTISPPSGLSVPSDGFIDNTKIEQYMPTTVPTNYAASQSKVRANLRYNLMINEIGMMANCYVSSVVANGADANTPPSSFVFTLEVERGDGALMTWDELNPGTELSGIAAITRTIARALVANRTTNATIYDPSMLTTVGNTKLWDRTGSRIDSITVGPLASTLAAASALVSITALPV